ncbi:MAG TPA: L,D-transpeptidase [Rhizomicrobium sp.]
MLTPESQQARLIKVEVLLDRAHFSPGVIDGRPGENLTNAIAAYGKAHNVPTHGELTPQLFAALVDADREPVTQNYAIAANDEKGPFIGTVPTDFAAMAKLKHLGYRSPLQELAERFHMSEALLRALNPDANFGAAGTSILVTRPGAADLGSEIARVEVDKSANQLRAYDANGKVAAVFPATVGSTERPAPSGRWAVEFVTFDPDYTYNPKRLTFGKKSEGALTIAPGPNNPVGTTWIELTKPTYGIHGSPDPSLVGKTASHGCVRLTNWDAAALGHAVKKGTQVLFVGQTNKE